MCVYRRLNMLQERLNELTIFPIIKRKLTNLEYKLKGMVFYRAYPNRVRAHERLVINT